MKRIYADLAGFRMERWATELYTIGGYICPLGRPVKGELQECKLEKKEKKKESNESTPLDFEQCF